ncbi:MAG: Hpt domain-containing protein [Rhodospirillaceae bacterium]
MQRGLEGEDDRGTDGACRRCGADPLVGAVPESAPRLAARSCPETLLAVQEMVLRRLDEPCLRAECGSTGDRVFDRGILDELASMLDDPELDAYLALLEPTVAPRLDKLARQFEAGERGGMMETAHALAGGAACYGLRALSLVARRLENGALSEPKEALGQAIAEAAALVEASLSAVARWRCRLFADRSDERATAPAGSDALTVAAEGS